MTTSTRPARFLLDVPDHWFRLDLDDGELARARSRAYRAARTPGDRIQVDDLFRQARALLRAARRHGALWGAGTATFYDDGLFMGHVMVFAVTPPDGEDLTLPTLTRQLGQGDGEGGGEGDDGPATPRTVGVVTLPHAGPAVRITGRERVAVTRHDTVEMVTTHTLVPVPGMDRERLMISCCSPNLALEAEVLDLFDAIGTTFRYLADPGDADSGDSGDAGA